MSDTLEVIAPGGWLQDITGHEWDPLNPRPEDIRFDAICVGGAREGRYSNQSPQLYPVAVHEVLVSQVVETEARHRGWASDDVMLAARQGLLHDGSESITHDLPRGIKNHPTMEGFRSLEDRIQECVYEAFGVKPTLYSSALVKEVDDRLIVDEVFALMPKPESYMERRRKRRQTDVGYGVMIPFVETWEEAARLWAKRFDELWPGWTGERRFF